MRNKLGSAFRYLRKHGFRRFCATTLDQLTVKCQIFVRGRHRTVTLDGCNFPLRNLPDMPMKLALLDGWYEAPEREAIRKYVHSDWSVVELGACIGVVSCITNKLLDNPKAHVVVEINPLVIPHLEANRETNGCSFRIVNSALCYDAQEVPFRAHLDFWANFMHQSGDHPETTVPATQLKVILDEEEFEEFALICDIEGQEFELVLHEEEALRKASLIIMEVHPHMMREGGIEMIMSRLDEYGFRIVEKFAQTLILSKDQGIPHTAVA